MHNLLQEHDPRAVANYFIRKFQLERNKRKFRLDPIVLENMVYLADTIHFECFQTYLINDQILPGAFKDYSPLLEEALKNTANHEVPELITQKVSSTSATDETRQKKVIVSHFSKPQIMIISAVYKIVSENNFKHTNFPYLYKSQDTPQSKPLVQAVQRNARGLQQHVKDNAFSKTKDEAA